MILDGYWKSELHRYTLQLRFWSSLCRWTGSFAEHQVNKYLLYSAAIIRKLIEDEVDAKNEFQNSEYGIPELALLHYELPATEYPFDGDKDFILHKVVTDNYNAGSRNVTVEAKTICNSIIHSYVWNLAYSEGKRGTAGFLTASDREKDKKLYFVKISDWIGYEGVQRIERYFVPEDALREALLNAICHKQYQSGIPIQISVYEDRLYVANVGSLPENWTIESLMAKHSSVPYNPNIASVFYLAGFIESWGRGVEKICDALKADNLPMPEYTVHPGDIMIKFTGPEDRIVRVTDKVTNGVTGEVTDRERQVLQLLIEDPGYTMPQLAEKMTVSRKTVAGYLKSLKEKGVIERVGTTRSGHWEIMD